MTPGSTPASPEDDFSDATVPPLMLRLIISDSAKSPTSAGTSGMPS